MVCVAVLFPRCYYLRVNWGMDFAGMFKSTLYAPDTGHSEAYKRVI